MWIVAGVLLGLVVLASLVGYHTGPHAHAVAGAIGVLAAGWLVLMAIDGRSAPLVWALFGADVAISAGLGVMAWSGMKSAAVPTRLLVGHVEGKEGVAVSDLTPEGVVRVRGEQWSAVAVNGRFPAGSPVQVVRADGVRLEVWGEVADDELGEGHSGADVRSKERFT
ncbi:MAG TPA: NfeD family protein [Acidimicrobiales bacterium]|nr:NfeD family protein [Acidimicrobiales bacterium]